MRSWLAIARPTLRLAGVVLLAAGCGANPGRAQLPPTIHAVQGPGDLSPFDGQELTGLRGVVTSVRGRGFTLQSPPGAEDADSATSEGLLVVTDAGDGPVVGELLDVAGRVRERRAANRPGDLTVTTLESATWVRLARDQPLPPPVRLGLGSLARLESHEGMRVELHGAVVVAPPGSGGELAVADGARVTAPAAGGRGVLPLQADANGDCLLLDDLLAELPQARVGDRLAGPLVGVLGYAWGNYRIHPLQSPAFESGGLRPETAPAPPEGALTLASYNVENLAGTTQRARFAALARHITDALHAPQLVALQEIQDDSGRKGDGTVSATLTLRKLTDAIVWAGGPQYRAFDLPPQDGQDGGQPGGNIRVAFLVREGGGLDVLGPPDRVAPEHAAWRSSRKPLALRLRWAGRPLRPLLLINNHWTSRLGDDPLSGSRQPPLRPSDARRLEQAAVVAGFVDAALAAEPATDVIVLGDFNDFEWSEALARLQGPGRLECLTNGVPLARRHTYLYEGRAQALDHVLISPRLRRDARSLSYGPVHLNAEFVEQVADHDPVLLTLELEPD